MKRNEKIMKIIKSKIDKLMLKNQLLELKKQKISAKGVAKINVLDRRISKNKDLIKIENKYSGVHNE